MNVILKKRTEVGLTQVEFAEKMNVTQQCVSKWEQGDCDLKATTLVKIAEVLGCSVEELLVGA